MGNFESCRNVCLMQIQKFCGHKGSLLYYVCLKGLNTRCNNFYYIEKFSDSGTSLFCGDRHREDVSIKMYSQNKNMRI